MDKRSFKNVKKHSMKINHIFSITNWIAPFVTKLLLYTNLSANHISIIAFIFVFISTPFIAFGGYWYVLIGALLMQTSVILDNSDGAVARIKGTADKFGNFYCGFLHHFMSPVLIAALSINSYRFFNNVIFLMIGLLTIILMFLNLYSRIIKDKHAVEYSLRYNKKIKASQEFDLLSIGDKNKICKSYLLCDAQKYKFITNVIYFFNSYSHLNTFVLILAIFNLIPYMIIFYAPFYILISIVKASIEIWKGMNDYKFG